MKTNLRLQVKNRQFGPVTLYLMLRGAGRSAVESSSHGPDSAATRKGYKRGSHRALTFWGTAVVAISLALAGECPAYSHVTYRHTGPILLAYSADDSLCQPLTASLNQTRRARPDAIYVSEARRFLFEHAHLAPPAWVLANEPDLGNAFGDEDGGPAEAVHQFTQDGMGYSGDLFFHADVADEGFSRLVYMRNEWIGSHGDFGTEVWILKPGAHFEGVPNFV